MINEPRLMVLALADALIKRTFFSNDYSQSMAIVNRECKINSKVDIVEDFVLRRK